MDAPFNTLLSFGVTFWGQGLFDKSRKAIRQRIFFMEFIHKLLFQGLIFSFEEVSCCLQDIECGCQMTAQVQCIF